MNATTTIHPAHAANMAAKADRFARFLHAHGAGFDDPDAVAWMDDANWERIAGLMGETRVPSPATRAMTVVLLRALRAAETAAARTTHVVNDDPLKGLPR